MTIYIQLQFIDSLYEFILLKKKFFLKNIFIRKAATHKVICNHFFKRYCKSPKYPSSVTACANVHSYFNLIYWDQNKILKRLVFYSRKSKNRASFENPLVPKMATIGKLTSPGDFNTTTLLSHDMYNCHSPYFPNK